MHTEPRSPRAPSGEFGPVYRGRFAPSPTGTLHLGSLLAALGSFLDARSRDGRWLVRIEDLDTARVVPGSADGILRSLEAFGLTWDGRVEYQSRRHRLYARALERLCAAGSTFECSCTRGANRAAIGPGATPYPGTCRHGPTAPGPTATRFRVDEASAIVFDDRFQGRVSVALASLGDVTVRRRDGICAYQLAVVVDDAGQRITDVVRGADLIDSTGWQIALQRALALPTPRYGHLPVLLEISGDKLAKSRRSVPLEPERAGEQLLEVLTLLRQSPPPELKGAQPDEVLAWAIAHWRPEAFYLTREITL